MASAPIYNPVIPCLHPIPGGMFPGRMIRIQGSVPPGAQRFAINLQCGPNTDPRDDIALHLNFRFVEMCVVRNHLSTMSWGVEETNGGMPLVRGEAFEALVLCEPQLMKVALNGAHFCEFPHRIPFQRISHITVDGDVMIQFIGFEGAEPAPAQMYMQSQPPAYGAYGAPPAYGAPGYGAPQGFVGGPRPQFVQGAPGMQGAPRMHGYPAGAQGMPMQGMPMQGGRGGGGAGGMRGMPGGRRDKRGGMGLGTGLAMGAAGLAAGGVAGYGAAGGFGNLTGPRGSPGGGNEGGNEGSEAEITGNEEGSGNEEGYSGNEDGYDEGDDDANDDTGDDYHDGGDDGGDYGGDDD